MPRFMLLFKNASLWTGHPCVHSTRAAVLIDSDYSFRYTSLPITPRTCTALCISYWNEIHFEETVRLQTFTARNEHGILIYSAKALVHIPARGPTRHHPRITCSSHDMSKNLNMAKRLSQKLDQY